MGMNPVVAAKIALQPELLQKEAQATLLEKFAHAAALNNLDLNALSTEQVHALYGEFVHKLAADGAVEEAKEEAAEEESGEDEDGDNEEGEGSDEEESKDDEESEEKEASAKVANIRKLAQARLAGEVMADSFAARLNQLQKTAAPAQQELFNAGATLMGDGSKPGIAHKLRNAAEHAGHKVTDGVSRAGGAVSDAAKSVGGRISGAAGSVASKVKNMSTAQKALAAGGAAAALAGGGYALHSALKKKPEDKSEEKKEASFNLKAAKTAMKLASQVGLDINETAARLEKVLLDGVPASAGSQKLAAAAVRSGSSESIVNTRALELLELAGYNVNWNEVFG